MISSIRTFACLCLVVSGLFVAPSRASAEIVLENGVAVTTTLPRRSLGYATVNVPEGTRQLTVTVNGDGQDMDLYLKHGRPASGGTALNLEMYQAVLEADADVSASGPGPAETIVLSSTSVPPLEPGTWYVTALNAGDEGSTFTLTATFDALAMPVPAGQSIFPARSAFAAPTLSYSPADAAPIAVGDGEGAGFGLAIGLERFEGPVDLYVGFFAPQIFPGVLLISSTGAFVSPGERLEPWRRGVTGGVNETIFGGIPGSALPPGSYTFFLLACPTGRLDVFYFWSTVFEPPDLGFDPDISVGAAVSGMVVDDGAGGITLDDAPEIQDENRTPVSGAEVRIFDDEGALQASATSASDGRFRISGLEITHAVIEIGRRGGPPSEFRKALTLVREREIVAGRAYPVNRKAAVAAVNDGAPPEALIACTQNPLPQGTFVFPTFGDVDTGQLGVNQAHVVSAGDEWFCLVDDDPEALWAHKVAYVFIHGVTGAMDRQTAYWQPSLNFIPLWGYEGDLFRFDPEEVYNTEGFLEGSSASAYSVRLSRDLVHLPVPDLGNVSPASLPGETGKALTLLPKADTAPEDRFAFLWTGSPEGWFLRDMYRMWQWCINQGIPSGNITTIVLGIPSSRVAQAVEARTLVRDMDPVAATRAAVARLAAEVQARRDAGGHPVLFVYTVTHGNAKGELIAVDNVLLAVGRHYYPQVFGNKLLSPVGTLLPIHTVPACQIRWAMTNCRGASHLLRLIGAFSGTDHDVTIYTASGYGPGTGKGLWKAFSDTYMEAFGDLSNLQNGIEIGINLGSKLAGVGTYMGRDWVDGASLGSDWELSLSPSLSGSFHPSSSAEDVEAFKNDPGRRGVNDRIVWDPGRPDPCTTGGGGGGGGSGLDPGGGGGVDQCVVDPASCDADGDGYGRDTDCNDADALIHPGATETCGDGVDQNCDGSDLPCQATETVSIGSIEGGFQHFSGFSHVLVRGTVLSSGGAPVAGATVTLRMQPGGATTTATTDASGTFDGGFTIYEYGTYTVSVLGVTGSGMSYDPAGNGADSVTVVVQ